MSTSTVTPKTTATKTISERFLTRLETTFQRSLSGELTDSKNASIREDKAFELFKANLFDLLEKNNGPSKGNLPAGMRVQDLINVYNRSIELKRFEANIHRTAVYPVVQPRHLGPIKAVFESDKVTIKGKNPLGATDKLLETIQRTGGTMPKSSEPNARAQAAYDATIKAVTSDFHSHFTDPNGFHETQPKVIQRVVGLYVIEALANKSGKFTPADFENIDRTRAFKDRMNLNRRVDLLRDLTKNEQNLSLLKHYFTAKAQAILNAEARKSQQLGNAEVKAYETIRQEVLNEMVERRLISGNIVNKEGIAIWGNSQLNPHFKQVTLMNEVAKDFFPEMEYLDVSIQRSETRRKSDTRKIEKPELPNDNFSVESETVWLAEDNTTFTLDDLIDMKNDELIYFLSHTINVSNMKSEDIYTIVKGRVEKEVPGNNKGRTLSEIDMLATFFNLFPKLPKDTKDKVVDFIYTGKTDTDTNPDSNKDKTEKTTAPENEQEPEKNNLKGLDNLDTRYDIYIDILTGKYVFESHDQESDKNRDIQNLIDELNNDKEKSQGDYIRLVGEGSRLGLSWDFLSGLWDKYNSLDGTAINHGGDTNINLEGDTTINNGGDTNINLEGDTTINNGGDTNINLEGDTTINNGGDSNINLEGDTTINHGGDSNINLEGDTTINNGGDTNINLEGDTTINHGGDTNINLEGDTTINNGGDSNINLEGDTTINNGGDTNTNLEGDTTINNGGDSNINLEGDTTINNGGDSNINLEGDTTINNGGDSNINLEGDTTINHGGDSNINLEGDTTINNGGDTNINLEGDTTINHGGDTNINLEGDTTINNGGDTNINLEGDTTINNGGDSNINLEGDTTINNGGDSNINLEGDTTINNGGDTNINLEGDTTINNGGDTNINLEGDTTINNGGDTNINLEGDTTINNGGDTNIKQEGDTTINNGGDTNIKQEGDTTINNGGDTITNRGNRLTIHVDTFNWFKTPVMKLVEKAKEVHRNLKAPKFEKHVPKECNTNVKHELGKATKELENDMQRFNEKIDIQFSLGGEGVTYSKVSASNVFETHANKDYTHRWHEKIMNFLADNGFKVENSINATGARFDEPSFGEKEQIDTFLANKRAWDSIGLPESKQEMELEV